MPFEVRYGTYTHSDSVEVVISRSIITDNRGFSKFIRHTWTLRGMLKEDDTATLVTSITSLESAYADNGKDIGLYTSAGGSTAMHAMTSSDMVGGVRVVHTPSYPDGRGAEGTTYRKYEIVLEGDEAHSEVQQIVEWHEVTVVIGTGRAPHLYRVPLIGAPQKQFLSQRSTSRCIQTGQAVGFSGYALPPGPLFPAFEHEDQRRIEFGSPENHRGAFRNWPSGWSYEFEFPFGGAAIPNRR